RSFAEVIVPICRQFAPEFVLVSAGFDCDIRDPLGGLAVTPAGIASMARACVELAEECAGGRIVGVPGGGSALEASTDGVNVLSEPLRGERTRPDPLTGDARRAGPVLDRVRTAQSPYWRV